MHVAEEASKIWRGLTGCWPGGWWHTRVASPVLWKLNTLKKKKKGKKAEHVPFRVLSQAWEKWVSGRRMWNFPSPIPTPKPSVPGLPYPNRVWKFGISPECLFPPTSLQPLCPPSCLRTFASALLPARFLERLPLQFRSLFLKEASPISASHPSTLAWRIPWAEEFGGLQPIGSQKSDTTEMT